MVVPRTLELSSDQRAELEAVRDRDPRAYLRRPRDPDTVYRWLDAYRRDGIGGLVHKPRRRRGLSP